MNMPYESNNGYINMLNESNNGNVNMLNKNTNSNVNMYWNVISLKLGGLFTAFPR